ncbi:MAG TPA: hypothetical protein VGL53_27110 [Bryobacteraceae bacterium]
MASSRFSAGCHEIVYTLVYPGVLASMLYDFYQFISGIDHFPHSTTMALIAFLYLLDYFHLFVDLKKLTAYPFVYDLLDLLIAVLFGLAFTFSKVNKLATCQACVMGIVLLMLTYSFLERSEEKIPWTKYLRSRWIYCALTVLCLAQVPLASWGWLETYLAAVCALYVAHIFLIWRGGAAALSIQNADAPAHQMLSVEARSSTKAIHHSGKHDRRALKKLSRKRS